ncbi:GtrA family protein [Metaclostridioides mangenotii]|uniref:GtrA family protein n=1 Tax=Metaclostridioides mangenotii TaxID=1540 RepID=UPI001FA75FBD
MEYLLTTLIDIATYAFCTRILGVNYYISNIIAWFVAVLFAYITNKFYVFEINLLNISML